MSRNLIGLIIALLLALGTGAVSTAGAVAAEAKPGGAPPETGVGVLQERRID